MQEGTFLRQSLRLRILITVSIISVITACSLREAESLVSVCIRGSISSIIMRRPVRPVEIWKWLLSLGAIPPYPFGAVSRPGLDGDEYDIAGSILGEPLRLVQGRTVSVDYPAESEIVMEGYISTKEHEPEGPFGEFTGFSTSRSTENIFTVPASPDAVIRSMRL